MLKGLVQKVESQTCMDKIDEIQQLPQLLGVEQGYW